MRNRNVEGIVAGVCRRGKIGGGESERLAAVVQRELARDDGAVLRAHDGRSSLTAYLTVVIQRLLAREVHVERANVAMEVLPELSLEERMLLRFHFGAGLSVADTARLLGAPPRSVEQRIDTLLRRLRESGKNLPVRHTDRAEIRA